MATTFKVPASPKKSIFEIDSFLGVDLTNRGTNIDEHQSPNAPNMTRYVPSKVRKRMGYKDKVIFTDGTDLNIALDTSDEFIAYEVPIKDEKIEISKLITTIPIGARVYFKCVAKSNCTFKIGFSNGTSATLFGNYSLPDEKTITISDVMSSDIDRIVVHSEEENPDAKVYVKELALYIKITSQSVKNMPWKVCPEDVGTRVVFTDAISPIYGCHQLLTQKKTGNPVKNTNRILGTSSGEQTVSIDLKGTIFPTVESIPRGQTVRVSFYYKSSKGFIVEVGSQQYVTTSASEWKYFDETYTCNTWYFYGVKLYSTLGDMTVSIKEMALTYERDSMFKWNLAPEERNEKLELDSVYEVDSRDNKIASTMSSVIPINGESVQTEITVQNVFSVPKNSMCVAEFDLTTTVDTIEALENLKITCAGSNGTGSLAPSRGAYESKSLANKTHISMALDFNDNSDLYALTRLIFTLTFTDYTSGTLNLLIENLSVREAKLKTDYFTSGKYNLYHVGHDLFLNKEGSDVYKKVYSNMNAQRSMAWQFMAHGINEDDPDSPSYQLGYENLYIIDGNTFLCFDQMSESVSEVYGTGYIPLVTIAKEPTGGGKSYEDLNLLNPAFRENFMVTGSSSGGTGEASVFQLSFSDLDLTEVKAWILENGEYVLAKEGERFTVNRQSGYVTFSPPVKTGSDADPTVVILAYKTFVGNANKVNKCSFGTLFGVNGATDRLFLSGNPDYRNQDWWSDMYNPTYFPERSYSQLGLTTSAVKGYAIVNNYLAAFKDENEPSQSVIIREGDLIDNEAAFKIINAIQGNGAISPFTFGYLQTEPLFLTKSGIFAITAQDMTGDKYDQNRSFYLNGQLIEEDNLENAYAVVYDDMYLLSINSKVYILDGLQAIRTDKSEPYATRQYVAFYWDNIPANVMWVSDKALSFGTNDGRVCEFATDIESLESYNDNGEPIYCCWETPDLDGNLFYKNKSFRYVAIRMMSALRTSLKLWNMARGSWNFIKEDVNTGIYFDFAHIDFSKFSFSTDRTDKVAHSKIRVKKVDKARFKIENGNINEPFGLLNLALEYVESGNFKG